MQDYLSFQQDASLVSLVRTTPTERILFADKIKKTNMYEWTQERTLVITNENVYNIHKKSIKRVISIMSINGISKTVPPSKCTVEFTIHVTGSYDYRFLSNRRDEIVHLLKQLFIIVHKKNCPIYGITGKDLKDFTTTEKDYKKGISKHPLDEHLINEDLMTDGVMASTELRKQQSMSNKEGEDFESQQQQRHQMHSGSSMGSDDTSSSMYDPAD